MQQTSVCGISHTQSLHTASNRALERLLNELGRNGPIQPGTALAQQETDITTILAERQATGVIVTEQDDGGLHHPV
jgi:hypothetical protein